MEIEETLRSNSQIIVFGIHILLALYIVGNGKILSFQANTGMALAAIALSAYVFNLLFKDMKRAQDKPSTPPPPQDEEEEDERPRTRPKPRPPSRREQPFQFDPGRAGRP